MKTPVFGHFSQKPVPFTPDSGVTVTANVTKKGCVDALYYYWWNCVDAQQEAGSLRTFSTSDANWQQYGWKPGDRTVTETHTGGGGLVFGYDIGDTMNWNWNYAVIYTYCGKDAHRHARLLDPVTEFDFWWDPTSKDWFPTWGSRH